MIDQAWIAARRRVARRDVWRAVGWLLLVGVVLGLAVVGAWGLVVD